jgi:hypothetical protein
VDVSCPSPAVRAFVVAVLQDRNGCIGRATHMIIGREFRHREILHLGSFIDAYASWAAISVQHYRVPGGRHSQIG